MTTANKAQSIPQLQSVRVVSNRARSFARLRKHRMAIVGAVLLIIVVAFVVIGSIVIPESEAVYNQPSRALQPPSAEFPFGTDRSEERRVGKECRSRGTTASRRKTQ